MAPDAVVVAVGDYDHTRDLVSGRVALPGVETIAVARPEELFARVLDGDEFDAAEMSLAVHTVLTSLGDERFVALPVFPARSFRHGAIFTRVEGASTPRELNGGRVGIPVWAQTAGVYVRGILATRYGVDLESIEWVCAGVDSPGRQEPVPLAEGPHRIVSEPERTLDDLLLTGDVDAVISARPPASVERGDPRVRRMFADVPAEERAYFRDTAVFPIMHVLVVRRAALVTRPDLADILVRGFTEAKERSVRRCLAAIVPSFPLPWGAAHARETRDLMGDDVWPYGLDANRPSLEAFLGFAADQGLTSGRLRPDELFASVPATSMPT